MPGNKMIVLKFVGVENLLGATLVSPTALASLFVFFTGIFPGARDFAKTSEWAAASEGTVPRLRCLNTPDVAFLNVIIVSSGAALIKTTPPDSSRVWINHGSKNDLRKSALPVASSPLVHFIAGIRSFRSTTGKLLNGSYSHRYSSACDDSWCSRREWSYFDSLRISKDNATGLVFIFFRKNIYRTSYVQLADNSTETPKKRLANFFLLNE